MNPKASVIIVNFNRRSLLRQAVDSILAQKFVDFELIVVDNASDDNSSTLTAEISDSRFRWVQLSSNRGFAGGCNAGFAVASGEYLALLNNDAVADAGWLGALVEALESDGSLGMCASKILFAGTRTIDKVGHRLYWDGQNRGRGTGEADQGQYDTPCETAFPDGCAALYRRQLIEETGGFDEDFFAYADDADLGLRGRLMGWKCRYIPSALVFHQHSSTLGSYSPEKIYWVERNRFWLALKTFPPLLLVLSPFFTLLRWGWNLAAFLLGRGAAGNFSKGNGSPASALTLARCILKAHWDGLLGFRKMWRKRRTIRRERALSDLEFVRLIWRHRVSGYTLAFRDRD